jgi:hypothetical protein
MEQIIYIQLLEEGTKVYRPIKAVEITQDVYRILESNEYDAEDEIWEFLPGSNVIVEEKILSGKSVLVAIKVVDPSCR